MTKDERRMIAIGIATMNWLDSLLTAPKGGQAALPFVQDVLNELIGHLPNSASDDALDALIRKAKGLKKQPALRVVAGLDHILDDDDIPF